MRHKRQATTPAPPELRCIDTEGNVIERCTRRQPCENGCDADMMGWDCTVGVRKSCHWVMDRFTAVCRTKVIF